MSAYSLDIPAFTLDYARMLREEESGEAVRKRVLRDVGKAVAGKVDAFWVEHGKPDWWAKSVEADDCILQDKVTTQEPEDRPIVAHSGLTGRAIMQRMGEGNRAFAEIQARVAKQIDEDFLRMLSGQASVGKQNDYSGPFATLAEKERQRALKASMRFFAGLQW